MSAGEHPHQHRAEEGSWWGVWWAVVLFWILPLALRTPAERWHRVSRASSAIARWSGAVALQAEARSYAYAEVTDQ